jgi:hypothetical protein
VVEKQAVFLFRAKNFRRFTGIIVDEESHKITALSLCSGSECEVQDRLCFVVVAGILGPIEFWVLVHTPLKEKPELLFESLLLGVAEDCVKYCPTRSVDFAKAVLCRDLLSRDKFVQFCLDLALV